MAMLLFDHDAGAIKPEPVKLALPENVPPTVRKVADDFALLYGLRVAVMDDRPLPYSARWRAKELGLSKDTVHRCLMALVDCGAIVRCEPEPGFVKGRPTNVFRPGAAVT